MSEEGRTRALGAALNLEEAIKRAVMCMPDIAELSNEELLDMERRYSYLHDEAGMVWKFYALEEIRRRKDGRLPPLPPSPMERVFGAMSEVRTSTTPPQAPEFPDHIDG